MKFGGEIENRNRNTLGPTPFYSITAPLQKRKSRTETIPPATQARDGTGRGTGKRQKHLKNMNSITTVIRAKSQESSAKKIIESDLVF